MSAYLQYIGHYFPEKCLTNEDLAIEHPEWSAEKISNKTGILNRYVSEQDETAVDMALEAAKCLFAENQMILRGGVDFVLLCTQSPDYLLPTSACVIQDRLQLSQNCGALDFNLGCSGYVYGLGLAKGLIESGQAHHVLLLTSETYTKYIHPEDKSCKTIFGDAATASLITDDILPSGLNAQIQKPIYRTIGAKYDSLIIETGMSRNPIKGERKDILMADGTFLRNGDYLYMDGKSIFEFTAQCVPDAINAVLFQNHLQISDIDWFVFHQANKYMLNFIRVRCGIPTEKFIVDLEDGGNTVSNTIPIVLSRMRSRFSRGQRILLCGFGVGLSLGCVICKIED